ncbi:hypothetical protein [Anatilimnocola aggregata]|uniref:hypothetical protein n=1 Tax=Anatilimnocola aggregata TaxID=2528021 RepID=UPI00192E3872|nr:hypothetical protein [Anatilimnocola aggregata]
MSLPDDPTWQGAQFEQIRATLLGRAETTFGPLWNCEVLPAPALVAAELRQRMDELKSDQIVNAGPKLTGIDKIYLVGVNEDQGSLRILVREFDARAHQFSVVLARETPQRESLPWLIWDAIARAFTPIAKIERVEGPTIVARLRAGGLITTDESPAWIRAGAVLRPVIRRNDRMGEPLKGGIGLIPWTLLEVDKQESSLVTCRLHSGYKSPIPSKSNARTERLALLVQPQFPSTTLQLRARDASRSPLSGYEIWRKTSETDGELVGATDWRGNIELPQAATGALQTLLVRSGGQLLARLPIVPGQQLKMEASVVNDDGRLQAEGLIVALQSKIMDLEARRQITAARLRAKTKEGKFDEAQQLLDQFRALETRADLSRFLDQQNIKSIDPTTQKRIEKLVIDARSLLSKFLDPQLGVTLQRELQTAKSAPPKPPEPAPAPAPVPVPAPMPSPLPMPTEVSAPTP